MEQGSDQVPDPGVPAPAGALAGRRVLLGVSGGIAAYKAADLVRRLRDAGAEVRVMMSAGATQFVTPLTFQALSGEPVRSTLWDAAAEAAMGHIELARWAELVLIAPASANCLARLAHGLAEDLISTVCLASAAPLALAPAMNQQMWAHAATRENLQRLAARGASILGPDQGSQACGDVGPGRMLEPLALVAEVARLLGPQSLAGRSVLVSAGPTYEDIDAVRYLANRSSGRMGYAIAAAAREAGAQVTLVSGPTSLPAPAGVRRVSVRSAAQMRDAVLAEVDAHEVFISAAAVADYRPAQSRAGKIKKSATALSLDLAPTIDILAEVGARASRPFLVGFAAETEQLEAYARDKLERKRLDLVLANLVGVSGSGFEAEHNELLAVWSQGERLLPSCDKLALARAVVALVVERIAARPAVAAA